MSNQVRELPKVRQDFLAGLPLLNKTAVFPGGDVCLSLDLPHLLNQGPEKSWGELSLAILQIGHSSESEWVKCKELKTGPGWKWDRKEDPVSRLLFNSVTSASKSYCWKTASPSTPSNLQTVELPNWLVCCSLSWFKGSCLWHSLIGRQAVIRSTVVLGMHLGTEQ